MGALPGYSKGNYQMPKIRVLVVDDETMLRHAMVSLLNLEEDIDAVGDAANGEAAIVAAEARKPDVILMDINMPKMDGIDATRRIAEEMPECAVVMLTVLDDDKSVFEAVKAGARGYVIKSAPPAEVVEAIRVVARGGGYLSPSRAVVVMQEFARVNRLRAHGKEVFAELSKREMEILALLGKGMRNREVAEELFISEKTVKNHVSSILAKLNVTDRIEAALLAVRYGLTETP